MSAKRSQLTAPTTSLKGDNLVVIALLGLLLGIGGMHLTTTPAGRFLSRLPVPGLSRATTVTVTRTSIKESAVIGSSGGTITVKHHQQPITLEFPKNSVIGSSMVTVSPIDKIDGMNPGSELVRGVEIIADESELLSPAALTFALPAHTEGKKLAAFSYRDNGTEFHHVPLTISGNTATLWITHFSGYGIITVPAFEINPYQPSSIQDRTIQSISAIFASAAQEMLADEQSDVADDQLKRVANLMRVWYQLGVRTKLDAIGKDPAKILDAAMEYNAWWARVQLYTVEQYLMPEVTEGMNKLVAGIKAAADDTYKQCKEKFDATKAGVLIKLSALAMKFTHDDGVDFNSSYINGLALKCANFTLKITSDFRWNEHDSEGCGLFERHFEGEIPLAIRDDFSLSGEGELRLTRNLMCNHPCSVESGPDPAVTYLKVPDTKFRYTDGPQQLSLILEVTDETDTRYFCPFIAQGQEVGGSHSYEYWLPKFFDNAVDLLSTTPRTTIDGWDIVNSGGIYARKEIRAEHPMIWSEPTQEHTVLELIHNPK